MSFLVQPSFDTKTCQWSRVVKEEIRSLSSSRKRKEIYLIFGDPILSAIILTRMSKYKSDRQCDDRILIQRSAARGMKDREEWSLLPRFSSLRAFKNDHLLSVCLPQFILATRKLMFSRPKRSRPFFRAWDFAATLTPVRLAYTIEYIEYGEYHQR